MPVQYSEVPLRLDPSSSVATNVAASSEHEFHTEPEDEYIIFYVGGESLGLTNILMTHASCQVNTSDFVWILR